jgi:hypothetical protein
MNRRRLLVRAGVLAGPLLAGCLGGEEPPASGTPGRTGTTGTATATTATTGATATTATPTSGSTAARSTTEEGVDTRTTGATSSPSPPPSPGESPGSTTGSTRATRSPAGSSTDADGRPTTVAGAPTIVDRQLSVADRSCGTVTDEGTIAIENGRVVAGGTITGSDACTTAVLDEATYDRDANRLRIVVATETERKTGAVCAQCLTEIDYEATVGFEGAVPATVVLVHRGTAGETRVETVGV